MDGLRTLDVDPEARLMAGWMQDFEVLEPFADRWERIRKDRWAEAGDECPSAELSSPTGPDAG